MWADVMMAVAALLTLAWIARHVWLEDVKKHETATDDCWAQGPALFGRAHRDD